MPEQMFKKTAICHSFLLSFFLSFKGTTHEAEKNGPKTTT